MGGCCSDESRKADAVSPAEKAVKDKKSLSEDKNGSAKGQSKDLEAFDLANETNDIEALIKLMSSQEGTGFSQKTPHPWAAEPKTVGALAGTQIAILCANDASGAQLKDSVAARSNHSNFSDQNFGKVLPE